MSFIKNIKLYGRVLNVLITYANKLCTSNPEVIEVPIFLQSKKMNRKNGQMH
jgi:hypothetical protein